MQEDVGTSPDRWTQSICPASTEPGVLTFSFADGSCATFTYDSSLPYHGAILVASKEGLRLDLELLPDHSGVQSLALHRGPEQKPAATSYCYVYGFKSFCQGVDISAGTTRHVTFSNVILKSKFDASPEILLNGTLDLEDPDQHNTFLPAREACGPATSVGSYGGCSPEVLADFSLSSGLTREGDATPCSISLSSGMLTFQSGTRSITASFDAAPEDQLQVMLNSQLWYTYRLEAGERLPGSDKQLGAQVAVHITNDGIDSVFANYRDSASSAFETYVCRGAILDQPWNHVWP